MALASLLALAAISSLAAEATAAAATCPVTYYWTCQLIDCKKDMSDFCKKAQADFPDGTVEKCFVKTKHARWNYDTKGVEHFRKTLLLGQLVTEPVDKADLSKFVAEADCKNFYEGLASKVKPGDAGGNKYQWSDGAWDKAKGKFKGTEIGPINKDDKGVKKYMPMHPDWSKVPFTKVGKSTLPKVCCGAVRIIAADSNSGHMRIGCQTGFA